MSALMWPVWWVATFLAALSGVLFGWLPVGTEMFDPLGETDQMVSSGGYFASALVLVLGAVAMDAYDGPRNAQRVAIGLGALYSFLSLEAALILNDAPISRAFGPAWHGATSVLVMPWSWLFVLAGLLGWRRLLHWQRPDLPSGDDRTRRIGPGLDQGPPTTGAAA